VLKTTPFRTEGELHTLVRLFAECSLPKEDWTHFAHLAVGLWHVETYGSEEALLRLRTGIQHLNESHGTVNSETNGYHETVTRVYVELLSEFNTRFKEVSLVDRITLLLRGPLADKALLLTFYSRSRLMSAEGRLRWVEPDLAPISFEAVPSGYAVYAFILNSTL
jgi:hypothetical protein